MDRIGRFILGAVVLILAYVAYLLVKPYVIALLTGAVFTYMFYPIYKKIKEKTKKPSVSAGIMIAIVVLVISLPLLFVLNAVVNESYEVYNTTKTALESDEVITAGQCEGLTCRLTEYINQKLSSPEARQNLEETIKTSSSFVIQQASNAILYIPSKIIALLVMFFAMYYLFKDGHKVVKGAKTLLPLKKKHQTKLITQFNHIMYAIVYGYLLIAIIQGTIGGVVLGLLGFKAPVLWGLVIVVLSIIPLIGTGGVYVPAILYSIFMAVTSTETGHVTKAIILTIVWLIVLSPLDTFVRPKIVGKRANIHPVTVLLGVLGGIQLFGFVGIILGPAILALVVTLFNIYKEEHNEANS